MTTGATEAIAAAMLGLVDPGDEVLVCEPFYDSYRAMIQFCGGVRRPLTLRAPDYRLDLEELEAAVTERSKVILLNTPHNPTGRVLDAEELAGVARIAQEHDLVVVSDEVYEHLTYGTHRHVPIATLPGMFERTVTISSSGKTFSFTGWKIGWASGPAELVAAVEGAKNWLSYSSGAPFQPAIAHAWTTRRRSTSSCATTSPSAVTTCARRLPPWGSQVHPPQGTYFVTTDVSALGWDDGRQFCSAMAERARVVAIPSQGFYEDGSERAATWSGGRSARSATCWTLGSRGCGRALAGSAAETTRAGAEAQVPSVPGARRTTHVTSVRTVRRRPTARDLVQERDGEGHRTHQQRHHRARGEEVAGPVVAAPGEPGQHDRADAPEQEQQHAEPEHRDEQVVSEPGVAPRGRVDDAVDDRLPVDEQRPTAKR